jgi:peptidoglycan hydrolase-like protein with peptidoglycan-binding domain
MLVLCDEVFMARIFFQKASSGYRVVRGEVVRALQLRLQQIGHSPGIMDGIFGNDTENALKAFQGAKGLPSTGKLTDDTWVELMPTPAPSIFDRCLQLTADFEGHGFRTIAGNFDGAGLTWGIIGYTLQHGEIQNILNEVRQRFPQLFDSAFGDLKPVLLAQLNKPWQEQLQWANSISIGSNKVRIEEPWEQAFAALGNDSNVQEIQLRRVNKYWQIGARDASRFNLNTEAGIALCFDIAVQNGGIDHDAEERRITSWIKDNPGTGEGDVLVRMADVVAENSRPQYVEDVRTRKRTIATGDGNVHGTRYATRDWGIG